MSTVTYVGLGVLRKRNEKILDVYYPKIRVHETCPDGLQEVHAHFVEKENMTMAQQHAAFSQYSDDLLNTDTSLENDYAETRCGLFCLTDISQPVTSVEEAYFKLQLLSQRLVRPHDINLDGMFGVLHTIAWSNRGPLLVEDVERQRIAAYKTGHPLTISHVDKFPYMINYHIPEGVRIASGSQVRLGAHLGKGTTVMPAGYVNFNAGTLGNAMIEGRVSAGVVVGEDSDIGGGASIMGTLSGGNKDVIQIGENCLLGANAGTGISLGDGCTIAAGLYIYAGLKVSVVDHDNNPIDLANNQVEDGQNIVKARALSGRSNMLFIQDSQTGIVLCKPNQSHIQLNQALHQND